MSDPQPAGAQPPGDEFIGQQVDQYQIVRELGRGGMATVYLARQLNMNRQVAIKILPRIFLHDPQFIERFKREVQLIAELEHPHILPVYDFGEYEGIPFIVMRYLAGGSLRDLINDGLPPLDDLRRPFEQLCSALDFAHGEGIIHRDLKPSNVMLDDHGNAYLSDFGIAQILQDAGRLTGSAVIGTPAYMSPEQAEGRPLDARSDVYALGVVLFEMVTGREPFQADTPMAMLLKQITEPMPSPRAYRPDLPDAVDRVILRATLKDPAARYPSALEFSRALDDALNQLSPEQTSTRLPLPPSVEHTYVPGSAAFDTGSDLAAPVSGTAIGPDENMATVIGDEAPDVAQPVRRPTPPPSTPAQPAPARPVPTTAPPEQTVAQPSTGRGRLWLGLVALVVVVVAAGAILLGSGVLNPAPVEGVILTAAPPTPFPGADTYRGPGNVYVVSMPGGWQKQDGSSGDETFVLWRASGNQAFAALRLLPPTGEDAAAFNRWIESYNSQHFSDARYFTAIDRASQPDGSLRASYRVPQPEALYEDFGPGQLDLFFSHQGQFYVVAEMFTADGADVEQLLPQMQAALASIYVDPAVADASEPAT
jgi:serine/threonine protein kinase